MVLLEFSMSPLGKERKQSAIWLSSLIGHIEQSECRLSPSIPWARS